MSVNRLKIGCDRTDIPAHAVHTAHNIMQLASAAQADLRQTRARPHKDREGARADFQIERALIAGGRGVEGLRAVCDDAREHVDPAG